MAREFFNRNGVIGTIDNCPVSGRPLYTVTDTRGAGRGPLTTEFGGYATKLAAAWADSEPLPAPQQMASPLAADEHRASGLVSGASGYAASQMSEPLRRMLERAASRPDGRVRRGRGTHQYTIRQLKAASRRGWMWLDDAIRPTCATINATGRKALARELAKAGGAR